MPLSTARSIGARILGSRWASPMLLLLAWELGSRSGLIPARTLAAPSAVAGTLIRMILSGELPANLLVSFGRAAMGLTIGVSLGIVFGLLAGLSRAGEVAVDPLMQVKRTIPVVALAPLFNGIRGVDPRLIDAARSFGLDRREIVWHVILPGALPSLLVGLRYSLSIAVIMLVIAEQINASAGLGYLINNARDFMRTDIIVVCLMVYALIGLAADLGVRTIERRALAWRPTLVEG